MKTLIITIVFAIMVTIGIAFKSLEVQANNKAIFTRTDEFGTGKVLGIHYYTVKQGIGPQEFERFMVEEWIPVVHEIFPGWRPMFMRGERGSQVGKYIVVWEISSLYVRNYYTPAPGENSEVAKSILEKHKDLLDRVRNRMNEMAERTELTDYVELVKK